MNGREPPISLATGRATTKQRQYKNFPSKSPSITLTNFKQMENFLIIPRPSLPISPFRTSNLELGYVEKRETSFVIPIGQVVTFDPGILD
jgi:hypothetical protein